MPVNYAISKPTAGTSRATAPTETQIIADVSDTIADIDTRIDAKAPLASPALTGTPTAPTAAAGTNTTQVATTAFVRTEVDNATSGLAQTALYLPGTAGNYVSTPDHADLDPAGDLEIVARVALADFTPPTAQCLIAKRTTTDGLAYQLAFNGTTGDLSLSIRTGATDYFSQAVVANPGWVDGSFYWLRMRRTSVDGVVTMEYAADQADEPTSWTSMTVSGTPRIGALDANAAPVEVGANRNGSDLLTGHIKRVLIRTTIGGSAVADFRADAGVATRYRDTTGKTWTVNGSAWELAVPS